MMNEEEISQKEFIRLTQDHLNSYIRLANQKASILLTAQLAFLGLMGNFLKQTWAVSNSTFQFAFLAAVVAALISIFFAAATVYPNTPETSQGLILWSSITAKGPKKYKRLLQEKERVDLYNEILDENYQLAEVADSKYSRLRRSILWTGAMVVMSVFGGAYFLFALQA